MSELKPCPLCHSKEVSICYDLKRNGDVACSICGCSADINEWNQRQPHPDSACYDWKLALNDFPEKGIRVEIYDYIFNVIRTAEWTGYSWTDGPHGLITHWRVISGRPNLEECKTFAVQTEI